MNHGKPPAYVIAELFEIGSKGRSYVKPRDGLAILKDQDLSVAVGRCAELRSLVNTILTLSGAGTAD